MSQPGAPRPVRTVLVDDDPLVRGHLVSILSRDQDIEVVGEASDVAGAVELVRKHRPQVMLLDIRMPGQDGVTGLATLLRTAPGLAVAMLTTFHDEHYVRGAVAGGAQGFLLKTDAPAELIRAVHALADGGAVFSPRVARWLVRQEALAHHERALSARESVDRLTPRQRQVLALLATGASNYRIARSLTLTEGTVKQYLSGLLADLGVDNRVQAAVLAQAAGCVADMDG